MKVLFIVNAFLKSPDFSALYGAFCDAAKKFGVDLSVLTNCEAWNYTPDADAVLFWDKDCLLAEKLEADGYRVLNSARGIEICDSKLKTALCLAKNGIPTPKTVIAPKTFDGIGYNDLSFLNTAAETLGFPMIIKEEFGSFGKQVYLAENLGDAENTVGKISPKGFVMQEYIRECKGRDLRLNVVGERVVSCIERYNPDDFRSNIAGGGEALSVVPTDAQKALAISAAKTVGLDFAGVDILPSARGDLICEINSNPHFAGTLAATGVNIAEEILSFICCK